LYNPVEGTVTDKGFFRVERDWKPGDIVNITLPMPVKAEVRNVNKVDWTLPIKYTEQGVVGTATWGPACVSVVRGPLLFSLPIPGNGNSPDAGAQWKFALPATTANTMYNSSIEMRNFPQQWSWGGEAPVAITVPAVSVPWNDQFQTTLPCEQDRFGGGTRVEWVGNIPKSSGTYSFDSSSQNRITLVPYGFTSLRMSMFPLTQRVQVKVDPVQAARMPFSFDRSNLRAAEQFPFIFDATGRNVCVPMSRSQVFNSAIFGDSPRASGIYYRQDARRFILPLANIQ
jgi:hypothetical protein